MIPEGTRIGPYRIVRQLGEGGMGAVYEGVHVAIERRVAIKVLHAEYARNREFAARFFNEARAVNIVRHPGLVQVSDFGQTESGLAYLVMEYLSGETLAERLRRLSRLSEAEALHIVQQLASALAAAHAHGIVHRDLKPGNVMIVTEHSGSSGERVKLLDFGIAKLSQANQPGADVRTRTGLPMGTPLYMAPEQCRGDSEIDGRTDVYALGIMLYQMVVGHPPFESDSDLALLNMHNSRPPPPLPSEVSKELASLVEAMLQKAAAARPAMAEVAELTAEQGQLDRAAVDRLLASRTAEYNPAAAGPRTHPTLRHGTGQLFRRAGRLPVLAGGALVLALVTLVIRLSFSPRTTPSTPSLPSMPVADPQTARPHLIRIEVDTSPPGATVMRAGDRAVLGQTPWTDERPAGTGILELTVHRPGYRDLPLRVPLDRDVQIQRDLERLPVQSPTRRAASKSPSPTPQSAPSTPTPTSKIRSHVPIDKKAIID